MMKKLGVNFSPTPSARRPQDAQQAKNQSEFNIIGGNTSMIHSQDSQETNGPIQTNSVEEIQRTTRPQNPYLIPI